LRLRGRHCCHLLTGVAHKRRPNGTFGALER
jgi:hypothetical protein